MRIATAREGESGIRLVTNKERITTPSILKPRKKWLPSCKISGLRRNVESIFHPWTSPEGPPSSLGIVHQLSRLELANRHSKEESQRV